ncbi:tyrosine-type recombinase/integrase [Variovorax dokdonensis]|uniref:Tyrosine-type recombinase/integrase n=1 Tax=Variovorax dokdonensis TaxID=344883 RepID=A0ABT7NAP0_9BURK|nr:site-specific integrase [Variovorax dokdonensis]MDM0045011.1 tyrosine-type recombinase/integrase [Variovorax dokdonensis]
MTKSKPTTRTDVVSSGAQIDAPQVDLHTERPPLDGEFGQVQINEAQDGLPARPNWTISAESGKTMSDDTKPRFSAWNKQAGNGSRLYLKPATKGRARAWRMDYRFKGRRKTLSLGTVANVDEGAAIEKAGELLALLAQGTDPSAYRKATKRAGARQECFESVARRWLDVSADRRSEGTQDKILTRLAKDIFPKLGRKAINEVDAPMLLHALRNVEDRGARETAHRIYGDLVAIFDFTIGEGLVDINPAIRLKKALKTPVSSNLAAITEPALLSPLLTAIDGYHGTLVVRSALQLLPMLAVRPGQLRRAEWRHIDLEGACWQMPPELRKASQDIKRRRNKQGPWIPLPRQAVELLRKLHALTGHGRYLFPGQRSRDRPMSENTINKALRILGYSKDEMTGHGFRASLQTICENELFVDKNLIEVQLQHTVPGPLADIYLRADYREFRRTTMQTWADYLDALRQGHGKEFTERIRRAFGSQRIEIDKQQALDEFGPVTKQAPAAETVAPSLPLPAAGAQQSFSWKPQGWAMAQYRMKA